MVSIGMVLMWPVLMGPECRPFVPSGHSLVLRGAPRVLAEAQVTKQVSRVLQKGRDFYGTNHYSVSSPLTAV